jgi:hypothetical protein
LPSPGASSPRRPSRPDEILAGEGEEEEPVDLDALFREEGVEVELKGGPGVTVLSDPPGARLTVASANIRPSDLLKMPRAAGRTPAELELPPGAYFILVEKTLGPFDEELIPALRTVHDGEGNTRTLIHEGTLLYDVNDCCTPRGLTGSLEITRIGRDQPGVLLGDDFGGMPPYLWDGNRYLILDVREGRVERVLKVYYTARAMGEERSVMATFIPSSSDPLEHPASMNSVSTRARSIWEVPSLSTLEGVARISGIPQAEVTRIHERLVEIGKAVWKHETVDGARSGSTRPSTGPGSSPWDWTASAAPGSTTWSSCARGSSTRSPLPAGRRRRSRHCGLGRSPSPCPPS